MVKKITATLLGITLSSFAADIAFSTPSSWITLRKNEVPTAFIVDDSLVGSSMKLTLTETVDGKKRVVSQKSIKIDKVNTEHVFSVNNPVGGGYNFHSIEWELGDKEGSITPFAIAPASSSIDPLALSAPKATGDISLAKSGELNNLAPVTVGSSSVAITWTPSSLFLIVKGSGKVSIALDPANIKSGFRTFSQREVTVDFDNNSAEYRYFDKMITNKGISYNEKKWIGDLSGEIAEGTAVISLPWYEIGAKPFAGRQLGVYISADSNTYPEQGKMFAPATWGNFILK